MSPAQFRAIAAAFQKQGEHLQTLAGHIGDLAEEHGHATAPLRQIAVETLGLLFDAIASAADAAAKAPEEPSRRHH